MKRTIAPTTLVIVFATVFVLGVLPSARADEHKGGSNASLQGSFGFTSTGTILPAFAPPPFAGPFGEIGRQTFDGKGNTEGTATSSANGNIVKLSFKGTYAVNPDCTGSMTFHVFELNALVHADFVIDDEGAELRVILTETNLVETRVYRKQFR